MLENGSAQLRISTLHMHFFPTIAKMQRLHILLINSIIIFYQFSMSMVMLIHGPKVIEIHSKIAVIMNCFAILDRLWRKTRSKTAIPLCMGADPNRNWDYEWCKGMLNLSIIKCSQQDHDCHRNYFSHGLQEVHRMIHVLMNIVVTRLFLKSKLFK